MFTKRVYSYIGHALLIKYYIPKIINNFKEVFMGKNSLLKSTSKKKKTTSKIKDEEVKTKSTKKAAPKTKAVPKTKKPVKAKAAPKTKVAVKAKAKTKAPAKKAAPKKKIVSVKDLVQKKFDTWKPGKIFSISPDEKHLEAFAAPPFVSGTKEETQRIKELLFKKFDIAEIKAAGEKATDEIAVAEPEVSVTYGPPDVGETTVSDPMDKAMKYMVVAFVVLVALIIGASMSNNNKYYTSYTDGALEIWQGRFSPMGEKLLITLLGIEPPEKIEDVYSKTEVFPLIFNYYVEKADTLVEVSSIPDLDGIKKYLNIALTYATTKESIKIASARLNNIDLMVLLYKAEVAASKPTISDLENAKGYLAEAAGLDLDDFQIDLINQKIASINDSITALNKKEAEVKSPETPPAE